MSALSVRSGTAFFLDMTERELAEGVLVIDGIFVTEATRGRGKGTALLAAI